MSHDSPLAAKRILVVEDEYFIARDLERALRAADAIVVGPVATLEQGLTSPRRRSSTPRCLTSTCLARAPSPLPTACRRDRCRGRS